MSLLFALLIHFRLLLALQRLSGRQQGRGAQIIVVDCPCSRAPPPRCNLPNHNCRPHRFPTSGMDKTQTRPHSDSHLTNGPCESRMQMRQTGEVRERGNRSQAKGTSRRLLVPLVPLHCRCMQQSTIVPMPASTEISCHLRDLIRPLSQDYSEHTWLSLPALTTTQCLHAY